MSEAIRFRCKGCEKKIAVRAEYAGKKVRCPGCKEPIRVPSPRPKRSATGVPIAAGASPGDSSPGFSSDISLEALAAMEANATAELKHLSPKAAAQPAAMRVEGGKVCPGCEASINPEAVLCVHCGHSFESGKRLKTKKSKEKTPREARGQSTTGYAVEQGGGVRLLYLFYGAIFSLAGLALLAAGVLIGGASAASAGSESKTSMILGSALGLALTGGAILFSGVSLLWLGLQLRVNYASKMIRAMCFGGGIPLALIGGFMLVAPGLVIYMGGSIGGRAIFEFLFGLFVMPAGVKLLINGARGSG